MEENPSYIGFPPLPDKEDIVEALVYDPPDVRWRVVRDLFRIRDQKNREELIERLRPYLFQVDDFRVKYRITLALQALHIPLRVGDYVLLKGKGAFKPSELESSDYHLQGPYTGPSRPNLLPVVDFHIHPKSPDLKFFADMREAGVTHGVILATDTDPSDVDRPEIKEQLRKAYSSSPQSHRAPFESVLKHIRASLYSHTHVTDQDVADWVEDYPDILIGFGSVNLSKGRAYVKKKLEEIDRLKLRGVKLLPHSQFFNPSENENVDLLFEYCRQTGAIVLSHSGCGPGPFEVPELSGNSHPALWEPLVKKFPDVPLVLAHFGAYSTDIPGIWLYDVLQLGKKYKNIYADLAAVNWLLDREEVVKEIRKTIGFDRVLFATDYPASLVSGMSLAYMVSGLKANTNLSEKEKRKVLGENAARLLGIA
ncbi:MAG: amidohydrolase [Desulfobacteraceae bacterium]|nr:amidohydrolase [Desulfobacteraceae bacterium]